MMARGTRSSLLRRPALAAVTSVVAVTALGLLLWQPAQAQSPTTTTTSPTTAAPTGPDDLVAIGEQLFDTGCVSCHGQGGVGTADGPSLLGAGEASADFMLRTGRMPLADPQGQSPSKPPAYSDQEIQALVAYVGCLLYTSRCV